MAVRSFGFEARDKEVDALFDDLDLDKSGTLDLKELSRQLGTFGPNTRGLRLHALRQMDWRLDPQATLKALQASAAKFGLLEKKLVGTSAQRIAQMSERVLSFLRANAGPLVERKCCQPTRERDAAACAFI